MVAAVHHGHLPPTPPHSSRYSIFAIPTKKPTPLRPKPLHFGQHGAMLSKLEGQNVWTTGLKEVAWRAGIEPEDEREMNVLDLSIGITGKDVDLLQQSQERHFAHAKC